MRGLLFLIKTETLPKVGVTIPILPIQKPRLREMKGPLLAYLLITGMARFSWTHMLPVSVLQFKPQSAFPISTRLFTLLPHSFLTNKPRGVFCYPQLPFHKWGTWRAVRPSNLTQRSLGGCGTGSQVSWFLGCTSPCTIHDALLAGSRKACTYLCNPVPASDHPSVVLTGPRT